MIRSTFNMACLPFVTRYNRFIHLAPVLRLGGYSRRQRTAVDICSRFQQPRDVTAFAGRRELNQTGPESTTSSQAATRVFEHQEKCQGLGTNSETETEHNNALHRTEQNSLDFFLWKE